MPSPRSKSKTFQASKSSRKEGKSSENASSRKHPKASNSHKSSASNSQSTNKTAETSGQVSHTSSFEYQSAQLNNHDQPHISTLSTEQQVFYKQQYSTNVLYGCANLGVEVPTSMRQALVDQHGYFTPGEFSYSTVMADPQYTLDFQHPIVGGTIDYEYNYRRDDFGGDLAGVGAQFEGMKMV